jgi:tRNA (cytidine/uridine-2'-O-)-methyltransferase
MFNIVLYQPEIPPNTGNIIRLCSNTGSKLHLIHPLAFSIDDKQLRRAGLDYIDRSMIFEYQNFETFIQQQKPKRIFACSTKGTIHYTHHHYQKGDFFIFGPETRGLPQTLLDAMPQEMVIRIPMQANSRSLNLSNAVAIIIYEAWRQLDFVCE